MGSSPISATRPVRPSAKTPPFHGGEMGSIPVRVTTSKPPHSGWFFVACGEPYGSNRPQRAENARTLRFLQSVGRAWGRIPRPKIGERLAPQGIHQAQGVGIFAEGEIPVLHSKAGGFLQSLLSTQEGGTRSSRSEVLDSPTKCHSS